MFDTLLPWALFILFIITALVVDLVVLRAKDQEIPIKSALKMAAFWVSLAMVFCAGVYVVKGPEKAITFLTGYLIEESLSVDNLFVFLLIFNYFQIPGQYQPKVLFWGILGAIVFRLAFIMAGITLIENFYWVIYIFGAFLVYSGVKLFFMSETMIEPEKNPVLLLLKRFVPVTTTIKDGRFFAHEKGVYHATPLFVALVLIETSDIVFAVDSVPAILSITLDPFIVYTSNIFAILGLRSIFFALAGVMKMFHYLNYGLTFILVFLGLKMLISGIIHISAILSLGIIVTVLAICIFISLRFPPKEESKSA